MIRSMMKIALAKKVYNEARKPHNQAKAKALFAKVTGKKQTATTGRTYR